MFVDSTVTIGRIRSDAVGLGQRFAVAAAAVCAWVLAPDNELTIRWVPAYRGAAGNDVIDENTKAAAIGDDPARISQRGTTRRPLSPRYPGSPPAPRTVRQKSVLQAASGVTEGTGPLQEVPAPTAAPSNEKDYRWPLVSATIYPRGDRVAPLTD